ncbi:hypothetical protein BH11MYX3_BH11MYX3_27010 [soil metagenome]
MATDEIWHLVEARRDDGAPTMFRIRDLEPRLAQPRIFVVEIPYPVTGLSRLPDASAYRRLQTFEEQWLTPAAGTLGWTFVAAKTEDGSFFLYLYGADDPNAMIERLSPFDGELGFFDEHDPTWDEYGALKELLEEANAMPAEEDLSTERSIKEPLPAPKAKKPVPKTKATPANKKAPPRKSPKQPTNKPAKATAAKKRR